MPTAEISSGVNELILLLKLFIVEYSQSNPLLALLLVMTVSSLIFSSLLIPYRIYTIKHTTIRHKHVLEYKLNMAKVKAEKQIKIAELEQKIQENPNE